MNRKEEIKRLPFVVSAYKQIYRSESCCGICNLPWSVCGHEHIDITDKYGVFYVCPYCGEATDFKAKVLNGQKRHTCRCNYEYWKKKITALQEKSGTLCLRQWADKPYRSPQESILEVPANMCIVQPLILRRNGLNFTAEVEGHPVKLEDLARNDGLTPSEFAAWFIPVFDKAQETALTFAIIQFTTFRY